jgi:hypothetical protein
MRLAKRFSYFNDEPGAAGGGTAVVTPPAIPGKETFSREYVNELREENKSWRLKHADAEKQAGDFKTAADKAALDAKETSSAAQSAADARVIRAELKTVALKAGMVDLDGLKLADLSTVKLDDKGEVEGADALIDALKKAKPYLFGSASGTSTPGNAPSSTPPAAKSARDMTPEEYAAAKKAKGYR